MTRNDHQLAAIARLYGVETADLIEGREVEPVAIWLRGMSPGDAATDSETPVA